MNKQLIKDIQEFVQKETDIIAVYLFGSRTGGYQISESDLDVAFVVNNKERLNENRVYDLISDIKFPAQLDMSVVDKTSSPLFLFEIIKTGQRIYTKNREEVENFEAKVLDNYYDTAHIRNIYAGYLEQKFPLKAYDR